MHFFSAISTYFKTGGPFMLIILGTGVVILAIVLERFWVIARASSLNSGRFGADLEGMVTKGQTNNAVALCRKVSTPASEVALRIFGEANGAGRYQEAADEAATLVLPPLTRRLPHLTMLANVATLLGLLGTIFGLTTAFSAVGAADPSQRSAFLAAGISQALNTTSFGLIIAVPTLIGHGYLVSAVERIVDQVDEVSIRLVRALHKAPQAGSKPQMQVQGRTEVA
jgi:biopolymer transport protein ExbB